MSFGPLDLLLVSDTLREWCLTRGLDHPRVAGLLGAGRELLPGMVMEVYIESRQEMTAGDLARLSREASEVAGWEVLLWRAQSAAKTSLWASA